MKRTVYCWLGKATLGLVFFVEGWRKIAELRYGWEPYTEANLVNEDRLPASTFRLEIQ